MHHGRKNMNSIEDLKIQSFWIDHIAPIAKALHDRGIKLIDDEKFGSSWTQADTISLDFENLTFEIIEEQLCQRFKNDNLDELEPEIELRLNSLRIFAYP